MIKVVINDLNKITRPLYQTFLIFITTIILFILTLYPLKTFKNFDPAPELFIFSEAQKAKLKPIKTGFYLRNFLQFDMLKNEFIVEGIVWFIYDKSKISLDIIKNFSFSKGEFIKGEFIDKVVEQTTKISTNEELVRFNVRIKFSSNLNYKLFPLDSHKLYLAMNNKYISAKDMYFDVVQSRFVVPDSLFAFGWNKLGHEVKTGFAEFALDETDNSKTSIIPRALFSIDFITGSFRNILLIFLPLFVVFFLSIFLFSLDPVKYREVIMTISAATVPAILAYRFVIESISPKVAYFMLSDQIFNLFLLLSFAVFIGTLYYEKFRKRIGLLIISLHLILILSWIYLLHIWT